jgi:hypothetical protein
MCTRPRFDKWAFNAKALVEDSIVNPSRVYEWIKGGEIPVGVGDWRPIYGRYTFEIMNGNGNGK